MISGNHQVSTWLYFLPIVLEVYSKYWASYKNACILLAEFVTTSVLFYFVCFPLNLIAGHSEDKSIINACSADTDPLLLKIFMTCLVNMRLESFVILNALSIRQRRPYVWFLMSCHFSWKWSLSWQLKNENKNCACDLNLIGYWAFRWSYFENSSW